MDMKWRMALPVLLSLLIPLPLVWLVYTGMSGPSRHMALPQSKSLVPMFSHDERLGLTTYAHDCRSDADCDPQLRCVYDVRTSREQCMDSMCTNDGHCPVGFACIPFGAVNEKDVVLVCSLVGVRTEGDLCESLPEDRTDGCARGLVCQGFCGRPCRVDAPASCPEGYFCHEGSEGASCLPTCEGRSCPTGQRCVRLMAEQASVCMTVHGQDCELDPCPQDQQCTRMTYPSTPGQIWMECLRGCGGEKDPPCPDGTACFLFQCRKSCDPLDSSVCGPGFRCGRNHPNMPWACIPGLTSSKGN
jgi:hypothetical protein